jgi:hypothetical protein|tara:strand:+ start:262 stop:462 length:201 start_codon:yes stop_codon:yes gene_type:complete
MKNLLSQGISLIRKTVALLFILAVIFAGGYAIVYAVCKSYLYLGLFLSGCAAFLAGVYMLNSVKIK